MASEAEYWAARRRALLEQMEADEARLQEKLARVYKRQVAELERDIAAYYQKYGRDNVIQYRRLMEDLSASDRRLLMARMEDFAAKYPQYAHLLPVRASIYRLNQLEGIQTAMRIQQLEVGAIEQSELDGHFEKLAMQAANLAAEEMGFGTSFYNIDSEVVADTVGEAWSKGESYSEIIWDNREKLASYLNDDFAKMIARGTPYAECAAALADRFVNVSSNCIKRLVFTEGTFLFNEAQARVHEKDFGYYAISCADPRACEVCRGLQAEQKRNPARFEDRAPGVNFPPMHPWCRCSYTVEVADWDAWIDDYVAARGGDAATPSYADQLIGNAKAHEKEATALLKSMERDDLRLEGLDFRIKGKGSLERKIATDAASAGISQKQSSSMISDVLRYTYVMPEESFVADYMSIVAALNDKGYNVPVVKNTLKSENVSYRGVNTKVQAPDGYLFELQFHTQRSFHVKEKVNHPLYERARLPQTPRKERDELMRQMVENSNSISTPPRIEEVR